MEFNYEEESLNSIDESEEEDETLDLGMSPMGRTYDCVFCKRGFNTAQALGGHMNIHRKDRATRNNIVKPNSTHHHNHRLYTTSAGAPRLFHHIIQSPAIPDRPPNRSPPSSTQHQDHQHRGSLDPMLVDNWSLRLRFVEDNDDLDRSRLPQIDDHKEELDLELRLGYDHS